MPGVSFCAFSNVLILNFLQSSGFDSPMRSSYFFLSLIMLILLLVRLNHLWKGRIRFFPAADFCGYDAELAKPPSLVK